MIKTSITAMIKGISTCGTLLLAASAALVQEKQTEGAAKPMPMQHEHHGFMQEGMHHAVAKGVKLDPNFDIATHTITLRVGPMNLPAHTSHMKMPQPPDLIWTVPLDGWLLAYHPKLVDAGGNSVPGTVLHHVAFWNENRADFLCPNKEEHIFGAGSELTDWTEVPATVITCRRTTESASKRWSTIPLPLLTKRFISKLSFRCKTRQKVSLRARTSIRRGWT